MGPKKVVETPKKEKGTPKGGKDTPKKVELPADITEINLKILEVHNIANDGRQNTINVTFMDKTLFGEGELTFTECACRSEADPISTWKLSLKDFNEETLMDITSQSLIVSISKVGPSNTSNMELKYVVGAQSELIAYCRVDMYDLVDQDIKVLNSKAYAFSTNVSEGPDANTVPNMPYIIYTLTSNKPLIPKKESSLLHDREYQLNTVSITTEFIMHPTPEMFEDDNKFEVILSLPLKEGSTKTVNFKQGYRCKFCEMPRFKTLFGLSHLEGDVKFSDEPTSSELDFENLIITGDCHLPAHLVRQYSQMICMDEVYRFKQFNYIIKNLVRVEAIHVEVVCTKGSRVLRFEGVVDTKIFSYVDQTLVRQAVPLKPIIVQSPSKPMSGKGRATKAPPEKAIGKGKGQAKQIVSKTQEPPEDMPKNPYAVCEDGYNSCLIIEILFDEPIIPLKDKEARLDEITLFGINNVFNEAGMQMVDKRELSSIFKSEILKFASHPDLKAYHRSPEREKYPMNDIWSLAENDLFGSSALLIANKYNFNRPMNDNEMEITLRNSYIYLINKAYDVLNERNKKEIDEEKLIKFRLQCAEECRELGYASANDFHIMNLKDTCCSARCLIDYAIFNLRIGDEAKALECIFDAIAKDSTIYDSYLLKSYVFFTKRDRKSCASTLELLTKMCPNFLEAWMALYILYMESGENDNIDFVKQGLHNAAKFSYIGHLHRLESILWPADSSSDSFAISMSNFITWGCIQFAELTLGYSIYTLGACSYEYLVHQALINYVRGQYIEALQSLKKINTNKCHEMIKIKRLLGHCFLQLKNNCVTTVMDVLSVNFQENKVYTPRCNLINLKMGRFFFESGRSKDARYYLKKCCKRSGSYASLIEWGNVLLRCRSFDISINCFKQAHLIDPYDWFPWAKLAILYYRSGLLEQYKICATNARENKITDEIISRDLDKIDETLNE